MLATTVESRAELRPAIDPTEMVERDLPLTIMRAIARAMAWRDGGFAALGKKERCMLVEIIRCISKDRPSHEIYIRRNTLALRLDYSLATVTRLLARLEELGWIARDQVKSRVEGFQVGSISLTNLAVTWLGFESHPPKAQRRSSVIDACSNSIEEKKEQSCKRQLLQADGHVDNSTRGGKAPTRVKLPASIAWLAEYMSPFGVCKLMKDARGKGLLLEDVTSQCADQIRASRNRFAYIRSLLGLDRDWRFIAAEKEKQDIEAKTMLRAKCELAVDMEALDGRSFLGEDGLVRKVVGRVAMLYTPEEAAKALGLSRGCRPIGEAFVRALREGRIIAWQPSVGCLP